MKSIALLLFFCIVQINANVSYLYRSYDLKALASVEVHSQDDQVALDEVFAEKYLDGQFIIEAIRFSPKLQVSSEFGKTVEGQDLDVVLAILKRFGHMIKKFKIDYESLDSHYRSLINQQLNKSCSKSLIDIELLHCNEYDFEQFEQAFVNVEHVQLKFGALQKETVRFDQLFPAVRRLDLGGMHNIDPGFTDHHFEHLEHLAFEFWQTKDLHSVERRLQLNPQLKSIALSQCNWQLLQMISEQMKHLQVLEINGFNDHNVHHEDIHFEHLKVFRFQRFSSLPRVIERIPLVFGQLEEISCTKPADKWFDIIIQNKQLKKVTTGHINKIQLFDIVEQLELLEDFTTEFNTYDATAKVVRFIQQGKHLNKVSFWQSNFNSRSDIVEQLGSEWSIAEDGGRFVFIKN